VSAATLSVASLHWPIAVAGADSNYGRDLCDGKRRKRDAAK
jgi:hypothetical protein